MCDEDGDNEKCKVCEEHEKHIEVREYLVSTSLLKSPRQCIPGSSSVMSIWFLWLIN